MKKFTSVLLSVAIVLCFTALGLGSSDGGSGDDGIKEFSNYVPVDNNDDPEDEEDATEYETVVYERQEMVDGETYYLNVGDKMEFIVPDYTEDLDYVIKWIESGSIVSTGGDEFAVFKLRASKPGEGTLTLWVAYSDGYTVSERQEYIANFVVEGEEPTRSYNSNGGGNFDNDFYNNDDFYDDYDPYAYQSPSICSKCSGTGRMPCPSCGGTGNLGPPSYHQCESYYCSGGYVACPYC